MKLHLLAGVAAIFLVAAACSSGSGTSEADPGPDSESATGDAPSAEALSEDEVVRAELAAQWVNHEGGEDCMCADGSPFDYWSRTADTEKVVLYFNGGGACFSAETCDFGEDGTFNPTTDTYGATATGDELPGGIFDFTNPDNPLADWSFVLVPYCTGDAHIGDSTYEYTEDLTVNHVGFRNASEGFDHLVENFPDATDVFVTGSSAGGIPAPLFGGMVSDALPDADVAVLSDASGAYPDNPVMNATIGDIWGTDASIPSWPETEGISLDQWSIPGMFTYAGTHDPAIRFARYDNAWDEVQAFFSELAIENAGNTHLVIKGNEERIESAGVPISSFIAPGEDHTILGRDALYTVVVEGVSFLDWITDFVAGETVDDVECADCEPPEGASAG